MALDPYQAWLGIRPGPNPPTYYELLGLAPFESDAARTAQAGLDRSANVRRYQNGPYSQQAIQLLGELSRAYSAAEHCPLEDR